jgi:hypothetical protein
MGYNWLHHSWFGVLFADVIIYMRVQMFLASSQLKVYAVILRLSITGAVSLGMDSLQRIVARQFNDLSHKRRSTRLKSPMLTHCDELDELVFNSSSHGTTSSDDTHHVTTKNNDTRSIQKVYHNLLVDNSF